MKKILITLIALLFLVACLNNNESLSDNDIISEKEPQNIGGKAEKDIKSILKNMILIITRSKIYFNSHYF